MGVDVAMGVWEEAAIMRQTCPPWATTPAWIPSRGWPGTTYATVPANAQRTNATGG